MKLPTLDTKLWWDADEGKIRYTFYEKPTVPNRTLQKETALSISSVRSSLTQDLVRRMLNCSRSLNINERISIIDDFSQKVINAGHSQASTKIILVHALSKYFRLVKRSLLDKNDKKFQTIIFR